MENYDTDQLTGKESDNGEQAEDLLNSLEVELFLSKLKKNDEKICKMIIEGYTQSEIINKLKTNYPYIKRMYKKLRDLTKC